jgi:hypothetical protein
MLLLSIFVREERIFKNSYRVESRESGDTEDRAPLMYSWSHLSRQGIDKY